MRPRIGIGGITEPRHDEQCHSKHETGNRKTHVDHGDLVLRFDPFRQDEEEQECREERHQKLKTAKIVRGHHRGQQPGHEESKSRNYGKGARSLRLLQPHDGGKTRQQDEECQREVERWSEGQRNADKVAAYTDTRNGRCVRRWPGRSLDLGGDYNPPRIRGRKLRFLQRIVKEVIAS